MVAAAALIGVSNGLVTDSNTDTDRDVVLRTVTQVQVNENEIVYWLLARPFDTHTPTPTRTPTPIPTATYRPDPVVEVATVAPSAAENSTAPTGGWASLVCQYNWDCGYALAIIPCESEGNPSAYNSAGYVGLFQVHESYAANLTDPAINIAVAYSLYLSGGWSHWPNCP